MNDVQTQTAAVWDFSTASVVVVAAVAAREARDRALASGLTVTTHKDGKLVQEKMVSGKLVEVFSQVLERDDD